DHHRRLLRLCAGPAARRRVALLNEGGIPMTRLDIRTTWRATRWALVALLVVCCACNDPESEPNDSLAAGIHTNAHFELPLLRGMLGPRAWPASPLFGANGVLTGTDTRDVWMVRPDVVTAPGLRYLTVSASACGVWSPPSGDVKVTVWTCDAACDDPAAWG